MSFQREGMGRDVVFQERGEELLKIMDASFSVLSGANFEDGWSSVY